MKTRITATADATLSAWQALALIVLLSVMPAAAWSASTAVALTAAEQESWLSWASSGLEPQAVETLALIVKPERRLLAARAYLRVGNSLAERWTWSQERIAAYPSTPEGKAAAVELDAVLSAFAAFNPGYSLRVNREARSLELQISRWNDNTSVGEVADALVTALRQRFSPSGASMPDTFRQALLEWQPEVAASLAAPGLSAHGQARAFDFQVEHQGQVVAGPDAATARTRWDAAGWSEKLRAAVSRAGNHFVGPLNSPYEPWHYVYTPAAALASP